MKENIQEVLKGYNEEKSQITFALIQMKDYDTYEKEKVAGLILRRDKIDEKIDTLVELLLADKLTNTPTPTKT